ncbi:hypothetical protein H5410_016220 [Solanum commersonii]|uniref:Uncharacterized protein n=1 Tax=Solanum commersonii TaxID=4109 RepID=A0A9J5ZWP5_SOLCO|nr:hypothetical protein H5410_016220 [Solanum commersonii]
MGEWIKRDHNYSSFFQEKDKAQEGSSKVHTSHKSTGPTWQILGVITHNIQGKLITLGIDNNIKRDSTLSS